MASILIIDDELDYCLVVSRYLESSGYRVAVASDADQIPASLEKEHPDLVLMDVRMPNVSGLQLLPRIKSRMPAVPVLVVTALNDYRIADLLYEAGADGFLTKPFPFEELVENIDRLLGRRSAASA